MAHRALIAACAALAMSAAVPADFLATLARAAAGSIVSLGTFRADACPPIAFRSSWLGGRLIFSDSPEEPATPGILYRDRALPATAAGAPNRIFVYHTHGGASGTLRFAVLVTNRGARAATLAISRRGIAGPSKDYLQTGKLACERWLGAQTLPVVAVPAGATVRLDPSFDAIAAHREELIHGIWDYAFDQPHELAVCALGEGGDPVAACAALPVLARDIHQRGTFPHSDKLFTTAVREPSIFEMGGNSAADPNAAGIDPTDGSAVSLAGNYGVRYRMQLGPRALRLAIQPLGGAWGGAFRISGDPFLAPKDVEAVDSSAQAAALGAYRTGELEWMPAGGASFPVRLLAVPERYPK